MRKFALLRLLIVAAAFAFWTGCATPPSDRGGPPRSTGSGLSLAQRAQVTQTAIAMVGKPYRWGGTTPQGFDCSGLVLYSYGAAGFTGLPHSARRLRSFTTPVRLSEVEPGDLLFFELSGKKTSHVAIYVGQRRFVHAPSSGKHVERVSFDHVYWGKQLERASAGRVNR